MGRHDGKTSCRVHRLAGQEVDASACQGDGSQGCTSECAIYCSGIAVSNDRRGVGGPERSAHQRYCVRRTPGQHDSAHLPGF